MQPGKFSLAVFFLLGGIATVIWSLFGLFKGKFYACILFFPVLMATGKWAAVLNVAEIVLGVIIAVMAYRFIQNKR